MASSGRARLAPESTHDVVVFDADVAVTPMSEVDEAATDSYVEHAGWVPRAEGGTWSMLICTPTRMQAWNSVVASSFYGAVMSSSPHPWERVTSDHSILAAFERVDRRDFLDPTQRRSASVDRPLSIGHRQTNSQPSTVARMLVYLDAQPGHHVLDVGSGSGWSTALLGHIVGPTGSVVGRELVPDLVTTGAGNLATYEMPWVSIGQATEGQLGDPERAPFDRILVSAEAKALPEELVEQLSHSGILVVPVAGEMTVVRRRPERPDEITRHGRYSFVPLL